MKHVVAHTLRRLARVLIGVSRRLDPPKDETRLIGSMSIPISTNATAFITRITGAGGGGAGADL